MHSVSATLGPRVSSIVSCEKRSNLHRFCDACGQARRPTLPYGSGSGGSTQTIPRGASRCASWRRLRPAFRSAGRTRRGASTRSQVASPSYPVAPGSRGPPGKLPARLSTPTHGTEVSVRTAVLTSYREPEPERCADSECVEPLEGSRALASGYCSDVCRVAWVWRQLRALTRESLRGSGLGRA